MRYDLEADWHLLDTCNYRCSYCFYSPETLGRKLRVFATPAQWSSALDQTGLTWLLHLTGGEPSIYPDFAEFCAALTQKHYVSFNTNLASHAIANLAQQVDPSRVSFVNAGFHTKERDLRNGQALFLRNAELLRAKGFPLIVSIVATPDALACFSEAVALLRPIGLYPVPKLLRGHFEGRLYPEAYSATDKARFRFVAVAARDSYREFLSARTERPSIDMFNDDRYVEGLPHFRGKLCHAGSKLVSVRPNGDVFRCGPVDPLGNLLDGSFVPWNAPQPCNAHACHYFCNKYTEHAPDSLWAQLTTTLGTLAGRLRMSSARDQG